MTAPSVPTWTATSISRPWSCHPVSWGMRMRCPDELIGRNSVIPWISAITASCMSVIRAPDPRPLCGAPGMEYGLVYIMVRIGAIGQLVPKWDYLASR